MIIDRSLSSSFEVHGFIRELALIALRLQTELDTRYDFASYLNDSLTFAR
jgi:hypothetical protein